MLSGKSRVGVGSNKKPVNVGDKVYPRNKVVSVDPKDLLSGERKSLELSRLQAQRKLIKNYQERSSLIKIYENGVVYDGHHGVRAAIEANKFIDVYVHPGNGNPGNIPIDKLPIR